MKKIVLIFVVIACFAQDGWERMGVSESELMDIDIAPSNSDYIYIVNEMDIYRTTDRGDTWTIFTPHDFVIPWIACGGISICVSYEDENLIYLLAVGTALYRSTDAGERWHIVHDYFPWHFGNMEVKRGNDDLGQVLNLL